MLQALDRYLPLATVIRLPPRSRLSDSDRAALTAAARRFARDFQRGLAFSAACGLTSLILSPPGTPLDLSGSVAGWVRFSRDIAAYPFAHSAALTLLKPDISTLSGWLPFTAMTSLATAAALRTADCLSVNWDNGRCISLRGWLRGAPTELAQRVGFQVGLGTADRCLPPADRIGGPLARDLTVVGIATLAEIAPTAAGMIAGRHGFWRVIGECSEAVSAVVLETLLYKTVSQLPTIAG